MGKSSFVLKYCDNSFKTNVMSTIGVDFKIKRLTIDGKVVKLQIVRNIVNNHAILFYVLCFKCIHTVYLVCFVSVVGHCWTGKIPHDYIWLLSWRTRNNIIV